ncbi:unnamed protein product [Nesidiocoris tenuis]|uniref:Reverse transcriptase domain-containing protein n=1 Tax=Nesidiocoris tenuis TaxID=355587 RepID=A0A6H5G9J9_9HEMI|nr:unnamed protein product [Nesidiocoris tenuis]
MGCIRAVDPSSEAGFLRFRLISSLFPCAITCLTEERDAEFQDILQLLEEQYEGLEVVVGGDWNSRIGNLNAGPEELFEGSYLMDYRTSRDLTVTTEGGRLVRTMENFGFYVINGRSQSDRTGDFTCFSHNGMSIVDLVWVNTIAIADIRDFKLSPFDSASDHEPCLLELAMDSENDPLTNPILLPPKFKWNPSKKKNYQALVKSKLAVKPEINADPTSEYDGLKQLIQECAEALEMFKPSRPLSSSAPLRSPWFNNECCTRRYEMRGALRKLRRSYSPELLAIYVDKRREYKRFLKLRKKEHFDEIRNRLLTCQDSKTFWNTVRTLKGKGNRICKLTLESVEKFYEELSKTTCPEGEFLYRSTFDPDLDSPISMQELNTALALSKDGKAAGEDLIPFEFFKNLPQEGKELLLHLFNEVLESTSIPLAWARVTVFLLFKKGDDTDPANYRGISLINSLTKIFSQILQLRLLKFVDTRSLLPENQNGFRKGRGTIDSIFTLSSAVSIITRQPGRKLFCAFIDFRRAFDSVPHGPLWGKLAGLGVSARFLRLLRSLYENASFSVLVGDKTTRRFPIAEGILQGDTLSPLLFALYLADFDEFLKTKGITGVHIDNATELLSLFYADDLALLSDSYAGMKRMLKALEEYCDLNGLTVNASKSKVMVFQRRGRRKVYEFFCARDRLEVVGSYVFLGVKFSSSGLFNQHAQMAIQKGVAAYKSMWPVIFKARANAPATWKALFSSAVACTSLYACEAWGMCHTEALERVQVRAFKSLLGLGWSTPDYLVRSELGLLHTRVAVGKRVYGWLHKLKSMDGKRLPRICFKRLEELAGLPGDLRYNWVLQVRQLMEDAGCAQFYTAGGIQDKSTFVKSLETEARRVDLERATGSSHNAAPRNVGSLEGLAAAYLEKELPFFTKRAMAQLRLAGDRFCRISWEATKEG